MEKRSNVFDIIKGIMILFIIVTHYKFNYPEDYRKYGFFFYVDMAVPVFMVITGYFAALRLNKHNINSYAGVLSRKIVVPQVMRFLIPYFITFTVEIPWFIYNKQNTVQIIQKFLGGGEGPGSYYTPVLLQIIFIFPIIYFLIKKYDFFGVILCFVFTGVWEAIQFSWEMDNASYARICFRYISFLAFGCYMSIGKTKLRNGVLWGIFIVGVIWQAMLNYIPLTPIFMNSAWARVNYLSSLFIMPILYILIQKTKSKNNIKFKILQEIGKASYNIYLVQMVFYASVVRIVYKIIPGTILQLGINEIVCCALGYTFYLIENPITKYFLKMIESKKSLNKKMEMMASACNRIFGNK